MITNMYKEAIEKNQVFDFFRGKQIYFDLDRDRGIHNAAFTSMHLIGYGTEFGEDALYHQLNNDLLNYMLSSDFSFQDLNIVLGFLWFYFVYRDEGLLKKDWEIPQNLIQLFNEKINEFKTREDLTNIYRVSNNIEERFKFNLLNNKKN